MSQNQNNRERFAGPNMIKDAHHMSEIPVQDQQNQGNRQSNQGQSGSRQADGQRKNAFEYENPRQVY